MSDSSGSGKQQCSYAMSAKKLGNRKRARIVDDPYPGAKCEPESELIHESSRDWASAEMLEADGLPYPTLVDIDTWLVRIKLDANVVRFHRGSKSNIVYLGGDCFFCKRPHKSNHWVLINSPGFGTTRVRCHDTGLTGAVRRFEF